MIVYWYVVVLSNMFMFTSQTWKMSSTLKRHTPLPGQGDEHKDIAKDYGFKEPLPPPIDSREYHVQYNVLGPRDAPRESTLTQKMNETPSSQLVKVPAHPRNKEQTQMVLPKVAVEQIGSLNPRKDLSELKALYDKKAPPTITEYLARLPLVKNQTAIGQSNGRGVVFSTEFFLSDSKQLVKGEIRIKEPMVEGQPPVGQPIVYFNSDMDPDRPESIGVVPYAQARLTREMTMEERALYDPNPEKNKFFIVVNGKSVPGADELGFVNLDHRTLQPVAANSTEAHAKVLWE